MNVTLNIDEARRAVVIRAQVLSGRRSEFFTPDQLAHLRFLRWLRQTGRLGTPHLRTEQDMLDLLGLVSPP